MKTKIIHSVSVLILTFNEEVNISRCLESVRWSNDVVILDSYSTDTTLLIAKKYSNIRIYQNKFTDYSSQRNYGIKNISFINEWVLIVDADEVVEKLLQQEILNIAACHEIKVNAFLLRRKVFLDGHWLKRNITYDFWIARLFRPESVHFEGIVHERVIFSGAAGKLFGALEHHQFAKGIDDWFSRRTKYALLEAKEIRLGSRYLDSWINLFSKDTLQQRASIKKLFYLIPSRWLIYFLYNIFVKMAFLDGYRGIKYIFYESRSQYIAEKIFRNFKNDQ